jgi:WD40 repeat protein
MPDSIIKWLGEKALGGVAGGVFSAPISFAITMALKAIFPSKEEKTLDDIQAATQRIETRLNDGFKQIESNFCRLESQLYAQYRGILVAIEEQATVTLIEEIKLYFLKLQRGEETQAINGKRLSFEQDVLDLSDILCGGPSTGQETGLLERWMDFLSSQMKTGCYGSEDLLRSCLILECRFDRTLLWSLLGVILVEYGHQSEKNPKMASDYHSRYVSSQLAPLLGRYRWCFEELVLRYLANAPADPARFDSEEWQGLINCAAYVFKRCDLLCFGVLAAFSNCPIPANLLTGRVIGSRYAVEQGKQRLGGLKAMAAADPGPLLPLLPAAELVEHPFSVVDLQVSGAGFAAIRTLVAEESSSVQVLRYWLAGFDDSTAAAIDAGEHPDPDSAVAKLRGSPAIDQCGFPAVWEKSFFRVAENVEFAETMALSTLRHRSESVFALALPQAAQAIQAQAGSAYNYGTRHAAVWQSQVLNRVQQTWNWGETLPQISLPSGRSSYGRLILAGHQGPVADVAITPDGHRVVSASEDGTVKVWDARSSELLHTLAGHAGPVRAVAAMVLSDGPRAVSAAQDHSLKVWNLETGKEIATLQGHSGPVHAVTILPCRQQALSASDDRTIRVWDLVTGKCVKTLAEGQPFFPILLLAVTPDEHLVFSGDQFGYVRAWDIESGKTYAVGAPTGRRAVALAVTRDGWRVLARSEGDPLAFTLRDAHTGLDLHIFGSAHDPVTCLAVTPDGWRAISGDRDGTVKLWDLRYGHELRAFTPAMGMGHPTGVNAVRVSADGRLAVSAGNDDLIKIWDFNGLGPMRRGGLFDQKGIHDPKIESGRQLRWLVPLRYPAQMLNSRGDHWTTLLYVKDVDYNRIDQSSDQWIALANDMGRVLRADGKRIVCDEELNPGILSTDVGKVCSPPVQSNWFHEEIAGIVSANIGETFSRPENWAKFFKLLPLDNGKIALQAADGRFLSRTDETGIEALEINLLPACQFTCTPLAGGMIALQSDKGKYLGWVREGEIEVAKESIERGCEFSVHFADPDISAHAFWNDGTCLDNRHGVSFLIRTDRPPARRPREYYPDEHDYSWQKGSTSRIWRARLLANPVEGRKAPLSVEVQAGYDARLFGWGMEYELTIRLRSLADARDLNVIEASKIPLPAATNIVGKKGTLGKMEILNWAKNPNFWEMCAQWTDHSEPWKTLDGQASVEVKPGENLWLEAEVKLTWPRTHLSFPFNYDSLVKARYEGAFAFQLKDIRLVWNRQRSITVDGWKDDALKRFPRQIPGAL